MNEQFVQASAILKIAPRRVLGAVYFREQRQDLTREEALETIEAALAAGYLAGYNDANSEAANRDIQNLLAKIRA